MKNFLTTITLLVCTNLYGVDLGTYKSLDEAKTSLPETINSGDTFSTNGYWSENDGGSAQYTIQIDNGVILDNGARIELTNPAHSGFYAKLNMPIVEGFYEINARQYGVKGVSSIASLYGGNDYYDMEAFPDVATLNRPNSISIHNIIRLMELSVFIKNDPFLSNEKVRVVINQSSADNVIPIANTWYITRGDLELKLEDNVTVYGDVTGYFENGSLYTLRTDNSKWLSSHNGATIVFANYGTTINEFYDRYIDIYNADSNDVSRDHDANNSKWIENIRIFGGGAISNFGRILKEPVTEEPVPGETVNKDTYKSGGNENGIGFHKVKNIVIENITVEDVGRKAITTQPGGGVISIKDVIITNPGYYGINLEGNTDASNLITLLKIDNTTINKVRLANAINIKPLPTSAIITNNKISNVTNAFNGNAHGILCKANESVTITGNEISNCAGTGIVFGGKQITINNNIIRNCHTGITFYGLEEAYNINTNSGSISNNQFESIQNLDITEFVPNTTYPNIDPDWDNIVIQNNSALDDILNLNEDCQDANISNNSPYVTFDEQHSSDEFLVVDGDLFVRSSSNTHARFVGDYSGIQGIQVERENGDHIRMVANYTGFGTGLESSSSLKFSVDGKNLLYPSMEISTDGNVGIGKAPSGYQLDVNGSVHTNEGYYLNGYNNILDLKSSNSRSGANKHIIDASDKLQGLDLTVVKHNSNLKRNKNESIEYHIPISQLKEQFPRLVKQDSKNNDKFVNYIGLIPVLVGVINNQNNAIDDLKDEINELKSIVNQNNTIEELKAEIDNLKSIVNNSSNNKSSAILLGNSPNPFSKNTEITAFVPSNVNSAIIYIYDLKGTQISSYSISDRNDIAIIVDGYSLEPGMYLYSLIIDNVLIDTKQMIITKD